MGYVRKKEMDEFAVSFSTPLGLECLSQQTPDLQSLVSQCGPRAGGRDRSRLRAQVLESGRPRFKYLFPTSVTLEELHNLSKHLCCHPLFLLHHKIGAMIRPCGLVWHLLILLLCFECSMERNEIQVNRYLVNTQHL